MVNDDQDEKKYGSVSFELNESENSPLVLSVQRGVNYAPITDAKSILVSIQDDKGSNIYTSKKLELYNMNGRFISEPIELEVGNYKLTQYIVNNASNNSIYATPVSGSPNCYLVEKALPINFLISKNSTVKVIPEVISTINNAPSSFGYTSFSFKVVPIFGFLISTLIYDISSDNNVLTTADIVIKNSGNTIYNGILQSITNEIIVNDLSSDYEITIAKDKYIPYIKTLTNNELKGYENSPLVIYLQPTKIPRDGLVAEYLFNGNANDTSGNNNNGTVNGATLTNDRKNKSNEAYYFDGQYDYIITSLGSALFQNEFTINLWINPSFFTNNYPQILYGENGFVSLGLCGETYKDLNLQNFLAFYQQNGFPPAGQPYSRTSLVFSSSETTLNNWTSITILRKCNKIYFYINGTLDNTADSPQIDLSGNNLIFGSGESDWTTISEQRYKGVIDDIRIYDRALDNEEIKSLYNE